MEDDISVVEVGTNMQLIKLIKCMSGQIPREKFQHTNTLSCFRDSCFDVSVKRQLGIKNNSQMFMFNYFRMLYHTTELNKNLFFQKLGHMNDDVTFISRVKKFLLLTIIMRTDKFYSHIYEDLSINYCLVYQNFKGFEGGEKSPLPE